MSLPSSGVTLTFLISPSSRTRVEIAHRADVEVDDAAGPQRPDIVDLDDKAFVGVLDQRVSRLTASFCKAELVAQIDADRRAPVLGVVFFARRHVSAAGVDVARIARIVRRCDPLDRRARRCETPSQRQLRRSRSRRWLDGALAKVHKWVSLRVIGARCQDRRCRHTRACSRCLDEISSKSRPRLH